MTVTQLLLPNATATRSLGVYLGRVLPVRSVLLLEGDLGSGKTTLVQGLGAGLGIQTAIDSPTFTLVNEYLDGRLPLYHLDLYRLTPLELANLHLEIYWEGVETDPGIVAIEWAERLPYKPESFITIRFDYGLEGDRRVEITQTGKPFLNLSAEVLSQD